MWFKNATIYTMARFQHVLGVDFLNDQLGPLAFVPGTALERQRNGWVPLIEGDTLARAVGQQYILSMRTETKLLPASVVNQAVKERAAKIEQEQGFKPGRKQMREIKEAVTDELLPKSHSVWRDTRVWLDVARGLLVIDSPSQAKCDEVIGLLCKSLENFRATGLMTEESPTGVLTSWLADDEPAPGFTLDADIELRSSAQSQASVRYVRVRPDVADTRRHIESGKRCIRMAVTWNDRLSFTLTDDLILKRISPLDILRQDAHTYPEGEAERFDADFFLMANELGNAIADIVHAFGGLRSENP